MYDFNTNEIFLLFNIKIFTNLVINVVRYE